jgi:rubrerythrin
MNQAAWGPIVKGIVERERRTLLQFVADVYPWTSASEEPAVAKLRKLIEEEQRAAIKLAVLLDRHHIAIPMADPFPLSFAALFFVSLDFLLPHLIEHQRMDISQLERALACIENADIKKPVESLLELKRRHLTTLQELAAQASKPVPA